MAFVGYSNRDLWKAIYENRGGSIHPGDSDWDILWKVIDQTPARGQQRNGMTYRDLLQILVSNADNVFPSDSTNDLLRKYYANLATSAELDPAYAPPGASDNDILRLIANQNL